MEMLVPDIGDFADVAIIEVYVSAGDTINADDLIVSVESEKASMDIPASAAGVISEVRVKVGDLIREGSVLLTYEPADAPKAAPSGVYKSPDQSSAQQVAHTNGSSNGSAISAAGPAGPPATDRASDITAQVVVIGAGPGGYTAAFRAADLGQQVVLVDAGESLGGVCLNVGCIPSKALLHAAKVIAETKEMSPFGLQFQPPEINLDQLREWKNSVVKRLTGGLAGLARQRKVTTIRGTGRFVSDHQLEVQTADGATQLVQFEQAIIAVGSRPVQLPFIPHDDPRVIDSTGALDLADIPGRLLILGGGIIGLEMSNVYVELGSRITVVELMDQLVPGADADLVKPLHRRLSSHYENIYLKTKVTAVKATDAGLEVSFDGPKAPATDTFDKVLVAVGRVPNGKSVAAENAGVRVDERGFIPVDNQMRTNVAHIYAIGDVVGQPMLAHKATHEAKVAAEVAAGQRSGFDARTIPAVAYTDPELAWAGLTETQAKASGIPYGKAVFPWAASGRALSLGRDEGITKLLFDPETNRVIGCGIVGPAAGDLIAEAVLAIEMGADATDIGLTIHPHPTLSETVAMAAETFEGTITDLYLPPAQRAKAHGSPVRV